MTSTDSRHRRIAHELFDALERGDADKIDQLYAADLGFWFNITGATIDRDENLQALVDGKALHRRRLYNDRLIDTFDDGFLARYTCEVHTHDGKKVALWACLVATIHDGRIIHMDEYLDSSKFVPRRRIRKPKVSA